MAKILPNCVLFMVIYAYIQGWSDLYLAYKRKTKILEKWRFISQHTFYLDNTWLSDAPISLTHLKNTFSRGLQSRFPWRRWHLHSTQLSARRVTFSSLETTKSRTGPNLENTVKGSAVCMAIWPIWPCLRRRCEPVRCHGGRARFLSQIGQFFCNSASNRPNSSA